MAERFAAYHLGHINATSTSVARGPSLAAAIDQRESPTFTTTPFSFGEFSCLVDGRLRSPGSVEGDFGFQRGSRASGGVSAMDLGDAGAGPATDVGAQAG